MLNFKDMLKTECKLMIPEFCNPCISRIYKASIVQPSRKKLLQILGDIINVTIERGKFYKRDFHYDNLG